MRARPTPLDRSKTKRKRYSRTRFFRVGRWANNQKGVRGKGGGGPKRPLGEKDRGREEYLLER